MGFTSFNENSAAYAGQISRADQSTSKAWAEQNESESAIKEGVFVAKNKSGKGVIPVSSVSDLISGISLRNGYGRDYYSGDRVNVMHIGVGDGVWARLSSDSELARGDKVYIVATGDYAGYITSASTDNIETNYIVDRISGDVAEITRKEV